MVFNLCFVRAKGKILSLNVVLYCPLACSKYVLLFLLILSVVKMPVDVFPGEHCSAHRLKDVRVLCVSLARPLHVLSTVNVALAHLTFFHPELKHLINNTEQRI